MLDNPFAVTTPEDMPADKAVDLFVDVFSDFPKVLHPGHLFLHGPRGSGKSMIFRYLLPDCQRLVRKCDLRELPFYSIYFTIKSTDLNLTELSRLENRHASTILNEHFMTLSITHAAFDKLSEYLSNNSDSSLAEKSRVFATESFLRLLYNCGMSKQASHSFVKSLSARECFLKIREKGLSISLA